MESRDRAADEILGPTDALKLRSSATLFARATPTGSVFEQILGRYYGGAPDERTLALLTPSAAPQR